MPATKHDYQTHHTQYFVCVDMYVEWGLGIKMTK